MDTKVLATTHGCPGLRENKVVIKFGILHDNHRVENIIVDVDAYVPALARELLVAYTDQEIDDPAESEIAQELLRKHDEYVKKSGDSRQYNAGIAEGLHYAYRLLTGTNDD